MVTPYSTLQRKILPGLLAILSTGALAQNNYVATGPSSTTPGGNNTLVGVQAGQSMNASGANNAFFGYQAGFGNSSGSNNVFLGFKAGYSNSTGIANVFVGSEAGTSNTTGKGNMFLGQQAGANNLSGDYNLFIGNGAGSGTSSGSDNTAIGDGSGLNNTTGQRNTAIGKYAGLNNQTGNDNVFIGFGAKSTSNVSSAAAIGANAVVGQNNSIVLGGTGVNSVSVGIGTTTPQNKLEITSGVANRSGLRFSNLTGASSSLISLAITLANPIVKVLTVDNNGDVVLAGLSVNLGSILGRTGADATGTAPWTLNGSTIQSSTDSPVTIGSGINKLPSGYKLYVAGGILTERVKVAIKDSNEWADYVFGENYKLRSLSEVEKFIRQNKHLPGVPSAEEVAKQGIDVGKMDAKLLEKIEELTLYMLELKKENQELKTAVSELQNKK